MSFGSTSQLYEDFKIIAVKESGQLVSDGLANSFNLNLDEAKQDMPNNKIIQSLEHARPRNDRIGDILVRVGQLVAAYNQEQPLLLGALGGD